MTRPFRFGQLAMLPPASRSDWSDTVRRAEDSGYATLQVTDHTDRTPMAPLLALAAAAQVSTTLRLGTLVLANDFREPAVLAKEAATLDLLSDGRFELGLGAGWLATDYEQAGIELRSPGQRIERLAEAVEIVTSFGANVRTTFTGTHYAVTDLPAVPLRPGVPLLLGGGGPRMLRLAARAGDIVSVNLMNGEGFTGPASVRSAADDATDAKVELVRSTAAAYGRDPELHLIAYWAEVADDVEAAVARQVERTGIPVSVNQVVNSPHCLVGPLPWLKERLLELRERWGFSYVSVHDRNASGVADLVAAMSGV